MLFYVKRTGTALVLMIINSLMASPASGQGDPEVKDVLETWQRYYEASIENIDDYVVVRDNQTVYYTKAYDNGRPYFQSRVEGADQQELASGTNLSDAEVFSKVYDAILEDGVYKGTEDINGHRVHVLYVDKITDIIDDPSAPEALEDVYLRIDPDKWVLRELDFQVRLDYEGEERIVNQVMQMRDYRDVEGMQVSYETAIIIRGLALTDAERREAEEGLAEFERELEAMPESQRRMVEQMMGDRLAQFKRILEEDIFETVNRVQEVRVNTGLKD